MCRVGNPAGRAARRRRPPRRRALRRWDRDPPAQGSARSPRLPSIRGQAFSRLQASVAHGRPAQQSWQGRRRVHRHSRGPRSHNRHRLVQGSVPGAGKRCCEERDDTRSRNSYRNGTSLRIARHVLRRGKKDEGLPAQRRNKQHLCSGGPRCRFPAAEREVCFPRLPRSVRSPAGAFPAPRLPAQPLLRSGHLVRRHRAPLKRSRDKQSWEGGLNGSRGERGCPETPRSDRGVAERGKGCSQPCRAVPCSATSPRSALGGHTGPQPHLGASSATAMTAVSPRSAAWTGSAQGPARQEPHGSGVICGSGQGLMSLRS